MKSARNQSDSTREVPSLTEPSDEKYKNSIVTVPNLICMGRLIGAFMLVGVAVADLPYWFLGMFVVLIVSDWIDGPLARGLHQRSDFGARLDSLADAVLFASLIVGVLILRWEMVQPELAWLASSVGSYVVSSAFGLWKFGRVPSYHTFCAKKSHGLVLLACFSIILEWSVWPLRICAIAGLLTNLEAIAISSVLTEWRADVRSIFDVWRGEESKQSSSLADRKDDSSSL